MIGGSLPKMLGLPRILAFTALGAALIALPYLLSFSQQEVAVFLVMNVVMVVSYRLVTLTGEWSLIHVVLQGVGAYATALLAKKVGVPVPFSIPLAAVVTGGIAFILSFPLFRMKAFSFLIGSFAAGEAIRLSWKYFDVLGGSQGINLIPPIPDIGAISFFSALNFYYLCLIVGAVSLAVLYRIERSRIGLVFHAIHWHDNLAAATGVNVRYYRTMAFVVASFFAGLTGAILAHYMGTIVPSEFSVDHMLFVVIWVIVGGVNTFYGPIIGVVLLTVLNELVLRGIGMDAARPMFYGAILILTMLFLPGGLDSLVERLRAWAAGRWGGTPARRAAGEASERAGSGEAVS